MSGLLLKDIHKSFDQTHALRGITFQVEESEIVAVLGPSGCGKSTLLYIIAGLERADRGEVFWNGAPLADVPPHRREFGLMFQDFALFPHRDVFQNVAFGLQMSNTPGTQIGKRVEEVLALVGLPDFGARDVNSLSGGEGQRVALARSLAPNPRLLMLDEPLGSLDRNLRERLVLDLKDILGRSDQTAIYVTHDQEEAFVIADRVVVMNKGKIEQIGAPQEIYRLPGSVFVARFLGLNNLLPGVVRQDRDGKVASTEIGELPVKGEALGEAMILLRPDSVQLNHHGIFLLSGRVSETSFRGGSCRAKITINGIPLSFEFLSSTSLPKVGEEVQLSFDPAEAIQVFPH